MGLTTDEARRAISYAINQLLEALQAFDVPWLNTQAQHPESAEIALFTQALNYQPDLRQSKTMQAWIAGTEIDDDDELRKSSIGIVMNSGGAALARNVLSTLGITADENSQLFADLSVELAKVHVAIRRMLSARSKGDHAAEGRLIDYYRSAGYDVQSRGSAVRATPVISDAWKAYASEKMQGPTPAWGEKNSRSQEATFEEFREIVGDIPVGEITREIMLGYRDTVARLPANRQKRYPDKSIADVLSMEIPADQLPASRTVLEKMVRIGAFLKWCRITMNYLQVDPLAGLQQISSDSQSYATFTHDDLTKMFNGREYQQGKHLKSWQHWLPLIALYTGARQTEIAQLTTDNILKEDGVWIFAITDMDDDQRVKTSAGVRKVPISSKLVKLGFLDYVAILKKRGEERLFPDLKKGRDGWGQKVSRWFGDVFKKNTGIKPDPTGQRKVFHSFRHTAITKALSKSLPLAHTQQVFGHEKSLLGETATYMAPFPVETLVPVIEALDYGLDHSAYKRSWRKYVEQWPTSYSEADSSEHQKQAA